MLADRYDLALSTASEAARDAYVQGCDLALTFYPGAIEAFDRAIAADPSFSLPHAGKAQVLMREGNVAAARAALTAAKDLATGLPEREASHIRYFDLAFAGQTDAAIDALYAHLTAWPRDALVLATAANPNGLIGASGRTGQKHQIAALWNDVPLQRCTVHKHRNLLAHAPKKLYDEISARLRRHDLREDSH